MCVPLAHFNVILLNILPSSVSYFPSFLTTSNIHSRSWLSNKWSNLALLKLCFYFPTLLPMCSYSGPHNPIYCPLVIKAKCLEIIFYSSVLLIPTLNGWLILSSLLPKFLLSPLTASSLSAVTLVLQGYYITSWKISQPNMQTPPTLNMSSKTCIWSYYSFAQTL